MESKKKKPAVPFIDICAYVECSNNRQQVSLYCFPKKTNPLCGEWLSRICNPALKYYSSSTLRRMGVCEEHFTPEMFKPNLRSYPNGRKTLKKNAVPEPSDHLVQKWREKLKEFMAARQIKRDHNIGGKEEVQARKGREEEQPHETGKEELQKQWKKSGKEEHQQQRVRPVKEQQQQRQKTEKEQQQQREETEKEEQQQQWKEPEKEEKQQRQETENEEQLQQRQEMANEKQLEAGEDVEEQEIEMCVNKPTRVYTKQPLSFSDDEDDTMEWTANEPSPDCVVLGEGPLKKTPSEMKLERENVKLKKENKYLKTQLKYLKRKLKRSIISRDRLSNELRKISK